MRPRKRGYITQAELAALAGVSRGGIRRFLEEKGLAGGSGKSQNIREDMAGRLVEEFLAWKGRPRRKGAIPTQRKKGGSGTGRRGSVPIREIAEKAGCGHETARRILRNAGWARYIPRERLEDALADIREAREAARKLHSENGRKNIRAALKKRWGKSFPENKPSVRSKPCDWRVSLHGNSGWLVVRCGTEEEMTAWADLLVKNGIEARAMKNESGGEGDELGMAWWDKPLPIL